MLIQSDISEGPLNDIFRFENIPESPSTLIRSSSEPIIENCCRKVEGSDGGV